MDPSWIRHGPMAHWWDQRGAHLIRPHVRQVHRMRHEMAPEGHLQRRPAVLNGERKSWEGPGGQRFSGEKPKQK